MSLKVAAAFALTLFCLLGRASAVSCFANQNAEQLEVSQLTFNIDNSVRLEVIPIIETAISEVNESTGRKIFTLSGLVGSGVKMDGVNTVSFSSGSSDEESPGSVRAIAYSFGGRVAEVDLVVSAKSFEILEQTLKQSIKNQLLRFVCE